MRMRRAKRKTDWLYSNVLVNDFAYSGVVENITIPFLPSNYIEEDAQGACTVLRIIGEVVPKFEINTGSSGSFPLGQTFFAQTGILKTQVDDTGVPGQLTVDAYGVPPLGGSSAIGGSRNFIWTKQWMYTLEDPLGPNFAGAFLPDNYLGGRFEAWMDIRRKVAMRSGEALVMTFRLPSLNTQVRFHFNIAYRILVATGRR